MCDPVSGVQNNTGGAARGVQAEHGLQRHKQGGHIEGFKEDLGRLLPIASRVERSLCEQHRMFF